MMQLRRRLKRPFHAIIFLPLSVSTLSAAAQNTVPAISNLKIVSDAATHTAILTYDLADAEADSIKIDVQLSYDGGNSFQNISEGLTGDFGFPVKPGPGKKLSFAHGSETGSKTVKVKLIADDRRTVDVAALTAQVNADSLRKYVEMVYGIRNHKNKKARAHLENTRVSLERVFRQWLPDVYIQDSTIDKMYIRNIIGKKPGAGDQSAVYMLGAHYDTVEKSPGADDNASGVAGMLEVIRVLSGHSFQHSVQFIAFDLEEAGTYGSSLFVYDGGIGKDQSVKGMINFDMIGYFDETPNSQKVAPQYKELFPDAYQAVTADGSRGNFVLNVGIESSEPLSRQFDAAAKRYVPELKVVRLALKGKGETAGRLGASDHYPFWDRNLPAISIGDGTDSRNPNYHGAGDTPDKINYQFMSQIVKATAATLATAAGILHSSFVIADVPR